MILVIANLFKTRVPFPVASNAPIKTVEMYPACACAKCCYLLTENLVRQIHSFCFSGFVPAVKYYGLSISKFLLDVEVQQMAKEPLLVIPIGMRILTESNLICPMAMQHGSPIMASSSSQKSPGEMT